METSKETTYDVRFLGHIWMPGVQAAKHVTLQADIFDVHPQSSESFHEAVTRALNLREGDFSTIDAIDVRKVDRVTSFERDGDWEVSTTRQRLTQVESFTDEEETAWDVALGESGYVEELEDA